MSGKDAPTDDETRERFRNDPQRLAERLFWIGSLDPAKPATREAVRRLADDSCSAAKAWASGRAPFRWDWWVPIVEAGVASAAGRRAPGVVTVPPTLVDGRRLPNSAAVAMAMSVSSITSADGGTIPLSQVTIEPSVVEAGSTYEIRIDLTDVPMGHYTGVVEARPVGDSTTSAAIRTEFDLYVDEASASSW